MKTYLLLPASLIALIMCSCEKDLVLEKEAFVSKQEVVTNPYKVSLDQALIVADNLLGELDGNKTRKMRFVENVKYITNNTTQTRSNSLNDTLLYLVNYADEQGFAILGADKRINPIYAISNEGSLNLEDTVENKAFAMCLNQIESSAQYLIDQTLDSTWTWPGGPGGPIKPEFGERKITYLKQIKPKIPKYASRWGQDKPYYYGNPFYVASYFKYYKVGCFPLACAQIMSYFQWPTSYNQIVLDWNKVLDYINSPYYSPGSCYPELYKFLHEVGVTLGADFGEYQTGVTPSQVKSNFHKFGYQTIGSEKLLNHTNGPSDLENAPLLVYGHVSNGDKSDDHAWVIDGYLSYKEEWDAIANPLHTLYYHLFHCVWGCDGYNNGYFAYPNCESMNMVPSQYDSDDLKQNKSDYTGNIFSEIYYWSNFNPVK